MFYKVTWGNKQSTVTISLEIQEEKEGIRSVFTLDPLGPCGPGGPGSPCKQKYKIKNAFIFLYCFFKLSNSTTTESNFIMCLSIVYYSMTFQKKLS